MSFKKLSTAILGSTGIIGKQSLRVISKNSKLFSIDLLACDQNKKEILKQIYKFSPKYLIVNNSNLCSVLKKIKFKKKIKIFNSILEFKKKYTSKFDKVILGISSIDGVSYGLNFLNISKEILVANKETIVCGGNFFLEKAKKFSCKITSIDSEHYCLNSILQKFQINEIDKIYLTASGGPFLNKSKKFFKKIDPKFALKHPTWKMGKKITIDSATMVNKCLEVMEASILYKIDFKKIKIKIHKESKVHSIILLKNGLIFFVAHNTDMQIPIENSLLENNIYNKKSFVLDRKSFQFNFEESKLEKFEIIKAGYKAINLGPRGCIFFNVINDYLVNLYLNRKIFFYEISSKLNKVIYDKKLQSFYKKKIYNNNEIFQTIDYARQIAKNI